VQTTNDITISIAKQNVLRSPGQVISELRGVTCHMGSRSATFHPTQVNTPRRNPSHRLELDLTTPEGWKAEWVTGYIPGWFTYPQTVTHSLKIFIRHNRVEDNRYE